MEEKKPTLETIPLKNENTKSFANLPKKILPANQARRRLSLRKSIEINPLQPGETLISNLQNVEAIPEEPKNINENPIQPSPSILQNKNKIYQDQIKLFNYDATNLSENKTSLVNSYSDWHDNQFCVFRSLNNDYLLMYIKSDTNSEDHTTLVCFDIDSKEIIEELNNIHQDTILSIRHYIKGELDLIMTTSKDNSIKIFDIYDNWKIAVEIKNVAENLSSNGESNIFSAILLTHKENDFIVSCNYLDNFLRVWNFEGKIIKTIEVNKTIYYIQNYYDEISEKNYIIINYPVKSFDFETGIEYKTYYQLNYSALNVQINHFKGILSIYFLIRYQLFICDFHNGNTLEQIDLNNNLVLTCLLIWNDKYFISGGNDQKIHVIDLYLKQEVKHLEGINENVATIDKIKIDDMEYLVTQGTNDDEINLWSIDYSKYFDESRRESKFFPTEEGFI